MSSLAQSVFSAFRDAATAGEFYPTTRANADELFTKQFDKWSDLMGVHAVMVDDARYDRAWIFNFASHKASRRAENHPLNIMCLLVDTRTGHLDIRTRRQPLKNYQTLVTQSLTTGTPLRTTDVNWLSYTGVSVSDIRKKLLGRALKATQEIAVYATAATKLLKMGDGRARQKLSDEAQAAARGTLLGQVDQAMDDVMGFLDPAAIAAAQHLVADKVIYRQKPGAVSVLALYNHIVDAGAHPRARENRISALPLVGATGDLYLDNKHLWDAVDRGESVFKAMGDALGVRADTIRHMVRNPALFAGKPQQFSERASYLNVVTHSRWPKNFKEQSSFHLVCALAKAYGRAFEIPPPAVLQQWLKEAGPRCRWQHLALIKLAKSMRSLLEDKRGLLKSLEFLADGRPSSTPPEEDPRLHPRKLVRSDRFWNLARAHYQKSLSGIHDLKRDIDRRIVRAALLQTLGSAPKGLENEDIDKLQHAVRTRLWQNCPPSEQIEASSYWHSPRVNFNDRFTSVSSTLGMTWHTLFDQPLSVDGIIAVPLGSDEALRQEGNAMQHCVWSYGSYCLRGTDHIFGLRDAKGQRLSTLNLKEEKEANGVTFTIVQNNSVKNRPAPPAAQKAGRTLCKMLNNGDIPIDWAPIHEDRAAYAAREIDASVGYDFRDPAIAQHVFNLYEPCLPRKIARASGGTLDGLARALRVPELVAAQFKPKLPRPAAP